MNIQTQKGYCSTITQALSWTSVPIGSSSAFKQDSIPRIMSNTIEHYNVLHVHCNPRSSEYQKCISLWKC